RRVLFRSILGPMLLFGLGMGLLFVPLTIVAVSGIAPQEAGAASSLLNVSQQVGASLGLSILVPAFGTASRHEAATQVAQLLRSGPADLLAQFRQTGQLPPAPAPPAPRPAHPPRGPHPGRPAPTQRPRRPPGPVPPDRPAPRRPGRPGPGPRHLDRLPARGRLRRPRPGGRPGRDPHQASGGGGADHV